MQLKAFAASFFVHIQLLNNHAGKEQVYISVYEDKPLIHLYIDPKKEIKTTAI